MDSKKLKKIRTAQRQKFSMRLVIAAGISMAILSIVFIIYFQFFQNDLIKAKNTESLTLDHLPVDLNVESQIKENSDTLSRNGMRYKIAKPLSQTPVAPVQ